MISKAENEIYLMAMSVLGLAIPKCDFWIRVKDLKMRFRVRVKDFDFQQL